MSLDHVTWQTLKTRNTDVAKKQLKSLKVVKSTYRADRAGNVQAIIGKVSFEGKLVENFKAFNETIQKQKTSYKAKELT